MFHGAKDLDSIELPENRWILGREKARCQHCRPSLSRCGLLLCQELLLPAKLTLADVQCRKTQCRDSKLVRPLLNATHSRNLEVFNAHHGPLLRPAAGIRHCPAIVAHGFCTHPFRDRITACLHSAGGDVSTLALRHLPP